MILDPVKLMPPELVPFAQDIDAFKADTRVRLLWPPIGIGGGGTVVAAQDERGADLAIKIILADTDAMRDQVKREANILKQVQHAAALSGQGVLWQKHYPHVDLFFLAMELVEGQTLAAYLDDEGTLDEATALEWTIAIAEGLETMHRQKIIHRDIKPENIILAQLGSRYQPILVDYGIAKVGNHTARGAKAATDGYAPPEQYRGGTDQRSDIYALGATLFEMVTGRTPPKATKRDVKAVLEPRQFNAGISAELEVVIQIATACDPDQRFHTMGALLDALRLVESNDSAALYTILQTLGLVKKTSNQAQPVSVSGAISAPQLPPLPLKKATPKLTPVVPTASQALASVQVAALPAATPAPASVQVAALPAPVAKSKGSKQVVCPYCNALTRASEMFCADCGFALVPGAPVGVAKPVSVLPAPASRVPAQAVKASFAPAPSGFVTPAPQMLSLVLARQIVLGGPALAAWEKLLLMLAYWLLLASLTLGLHALSLALALSSGLEIGSVIVFLLLVPLFLFVLWHWKRTVITRRGQARFLKRSALLLLSLLVIVTTLVWLVKESFAGQQVLAMDGPNATIVICAWLAVWTSVLIKALLA
ncbi:MAG TPA: serine/threonine-protein kinase [Ktedonobacterales bacterium]|nr:serine/threonine-protein kinase [Ktedonobacterales bacterium]